MMIMEEFNLDSKNFYWEQWVSFSHQLAEEELS
jgi:hypothetical protein